MITRARTFNIIETIQHDLAHDKPRIKARIGARFGARQTVKKNRIGARFGARQAKKKNTHWRKQFTGHPVSIDFTCV